MKEDMILEELKKISKSLSEISTIMILIVVAILIAGCTAGF